VIAVALAACGGGKASHVACERDIAGIDARLGAGDIAWLGEIHGTEQSPRFAGDVACAAARRGRVQLGLEIWRTEQPAIDRFVASDGSAAERAALLAGPYWKNHDGRSSQAMLGLIDRVRALRAAGAAISIVAYDVPDAQDRDAAMAERVLAVRDPAATFVGLSGNVHSRRIKGTPWDPEAVPMIAHLVARGLHVATFDVSSQGGTYWACLSDGPGQPQRCGEQKAGRGEPGEPWTLGPARDASHDGVYRIGKMTASPPAAP